MTLACAVSALPSQASAVCTSGTCGGGGHYYNNSRGYQDSRYQDSRWYQDSRGNQESFRSNPRDEEIMLNVRYALSDPSLTSNGDRIQIKVNNGVVFLRGDVDEEEEKQDIADAVKTIRGVRDVQIELRTPSSQSYQRQQQPQSYRFSPSWDDNLAYEELDEEFVTEEFDQRPASTQQQNMNRRTFDQDKRAMDQRRSPLEERRQMAAQKDGEPILNDNEIKEKIVDKLTNTWIRKKYEGIQVDVRNQQVTLRGTVDSPSDLSEIENRIHQIPEVKSINNEIKVKQMSPQQAPQKP